MGVHDGHRQRVKERFRKEGLDSFNDINVLEFLLFYCVPRIDTNELAHRLLDTFGSFSGVLDAPIEELEKVKGMGSSAATFLSFVSAVSRYYHVEQGKAGKIANDLDDCAKLLVPKFMGRRDELVYLLCMDPKGKVICCRLIGEGTVCSTNISVRKVAEVALAVNATSVILAHNHPNGLAVPSVEDVQTTLLIAKSLKALDIALVDHIVVAGDKYASMVGSKMLRPEDLG